MGSILETKRCCHCRAWKTLDQFDLDKSINGMHPPCKECHQEHLQRYTRTEYIPAKRRATRPAIPLAIRTYRRCRIKPRPAPKPLPRPAPKPAPKPALKSKPKPAPKPPFVPRPPLDAPRNARHSVPKPPRQPNTPAIRPPIVYLDDNCAKIPLGNEVDGDYAIVDIEDVPRVTDGMRWWKDVNGYAVTCVKADGKWVTIPMHRLIMNTPKELVVDHINHIRADNRKANLRNVTRAENNRNMLAPMGPRKPRQR